MKVLLAGLLLVMPAMTSAEIVAWVDDQGVRHYTNVPEDVPKVYRDSVRTVVKEMPRSSVEPSVTEPPRRELDRPERQRLAQVVYDRAERADDYVRGFLEGMAYVRRDARGGDINIQGPLAVARADASAPYIVSDPYYLDPFPFVTTAFDRGRSRHQTLRMLLQDQFQLDRSLPWVYPARFPVPRLGVDLKPFHPRGLPRRFPREARVIVR